MKPQAQMLKSDWQNEVLRVKMRTSWVRRSRNTELLSSSPWLSPNQVSPSRSTKVYCLDYKRLSLVHILFQTKIFHIHLIYLRSILILSSSLRVSSLMFCFVYLSDLFPSYCCFNLVLSVWLGLWDRHRRGKKVIPSSLRGRNIPWGPLSLWKRLRLVIMEYHPSRSLLTSADTSQRTSTSLDS